ncbi:hypothetical protein N302_14859, partial [Corvus brachyrhynchos]
DCEDDLTLWSKLEVLFTSLFVPGAAAARAHRHLEKLTCWVVKQANGTSRVLSELAEDLSSVQHALLQNRAAIDFLLLAHGHGCEDFEGMCCMDLEDHSKSIHTEIKNLIEHSQKIKKDSGFFGLEGLTEWMGLEGWMKSVIKSLMLLLIIVLLGLLMLSCIMSCVKNLILKSVNVTMIMQKE